MADAQINWYKEKAVLAVDKKFQHLMANIAFKIEELTKENIYNTPGASGEGLVDTGFMANTVYVVTREGSTYNEASQSGLYQNREGQMVPREIAPEIDLHEYAIALIVVGANYAIHQEIKHGFFFKAIQDAWNEGEVMAVGQKEDRL